MEENAGAAPDALLLGLNARFTHSNPALYGIRAYCRADARDIEIFEFGMNTPPEEIVSGVEVSRAGIVGISVYIWNADLARTLLPRIKLALPECRIVLGGPEVTHSARDWLSMDEVDFVVAGPGEEAFRKILAGDVSANERLIACANPPFADLPFPYEEGDFARFENRYLYYESSRGCPYRCSYCLSSREDARLEERRLSDVLCEMDTLAARAFGTVKFVDRTFNARPERARTIWRHLIESGARKRFHFEVRPALLGDEDIELLETAPAGLFQFEMGVQSTNEETLRAAHRAADWHAARKAIARLSAAGNIRTHLDLIAGLPFDTLETIGRSFDDVYALGPEHLQLGFLKVLPGTEMRERAAEYGLSHSPHPPYEIYENRWLSREDLSILRDIAALTGSLYNTGRFRPWLDARREAHGGAFALFRALALHWRGLGIALHLKEPRVVERALASFPSMDQ